MLPTTRIAVESGRPTVRYTRVDTGIVANTPALRREGAAVGSSQLQPVFSFFPLRAGYAGPEST
jgi:hypothetical protein